MSDKLRLYISFAEEDRRQVRELEAKLRAEGFETWFDEKDLTAGSNWKDEIKQALPGCDAFISCISTRSVSRQGFYEEEIVLALDLRRNRPAFVIPVRLDQCEVPAIYQDAHLTWIDVFNDAGVNRLIDDLKKRAERRQSQATVPVRDSALIAPPASGLLRGITADPRKKTRRVVAIMHGIRDEGGWMTPLKRLIEKETGAEVAVLSTDRIALTWFLLARRYLGYVKGYRDRVAALLSNYEEANIVFVAHSYGTWCLADIIENWTYRRGVMPVGIILCGSILPQNYPWISRWRHVYQRAREQDDLPWVWNDIGGRDPFPLLARLVSKEYGDAGVSRFTEPTPGLVVNRIHADLDHGGCFSKKDDKGNNILNEDFVRKFWLPIIRGEGAPRYGDDERTVPAIRRLSYWVKTAWEVKLAFIICQLLGWGLILLFQAKLPALLGWCLVGLGGAIPLVWLCMGWIEVPSPKKPKSGHFPVILKFILIPLLIVGAVWLGATALKPKTESGPPNKRLASRFPPIRGKMYTFGIPGSGADDTEIASGTNLTLVEPDDIQNWDVFLSKQPENTTGLMRRLDPMKFYLVCRYDPSMAAYLKSHAVNVTNPRDITRDAVKARVVERGPPDKGTFDHGAKYKDYAAGLSPELAKKLGLNIDGEVEISFE